MKKIYKRSIYTKKDAGNVFFAALMLPQVLGTFLYFILIFSLLMMGSTQNMMENPVVLVVLTLATQATFLLVYVLYNKVFQFDAKKASKLHATSWLNILVAIIIGLITLFGFQYIISYFDYFLTWIGVEPSGLPLPLNTVGWLIANMFLLAVMPAICEELIFRGVILNGLAKYGKTKAIIGSALLFALIHANIEQTIYPIVFGIVLAMMVYKTKSILPGMVAHFVNNASVIVINYLYNINVLTPTDSGAFFWGDLLIGFGIAILSALGVWLLGFLLKNKTPEVIITPPDQEENPWQSLAIVNDCNALENAEKQSNVMLWIGVGFGCLFWLLSIFA